MKKENVFCWKKENVFCLYADFKARENQKFSVNGKCNNINFIADKILAP